MANNACPTVPVRRVGPAVKKVIQELVVPELKELRSELHEFRAEIRGELKELQVEIKRLDEKIDSLRREMDIRFEAVESKIEISIEFRDRFTALEAKVAALSK